MAVDAGCSTYSGGIRHSADSALTLLDSARMTSPTDLQRAAASEVDQLVDELEQTLDPHQRRLLHQLRLAAETLGAIRATAGLRFRGA